MSISVTVLGLFLKTRKGDILPPSGARVNFRVRIDTLAQPGADMTECGVLPSHLPRLMKTDEETFITDSDW